jgi:hypothetical protein
MHALDRAHRRPAKPNDTSASRECERLDRRPHDVLPHALSMPGGGGARISRNGRTACASRACASRVRSGALAGTQLHHRAVYSGATVQHMGRKSREKRERAAEAAVHSGIDKPLAETAAPARSVVTEPSARALSDRADELHRRRPPTRRRARPVGARVARVAVDDTTWTAFRELCGTTPASIRLGQLVAAEVERANAAAPESAALDAVMSIRVHAERLEQIVRRASAGTGSGAADS